MNTDEKKLCVVHANCQGDTLLEMLAAHPEFSARYTVRMFTNYVREPVDEALLQSADLFLYQHLGDTWGELSSEVLLAKVKRTCRTLCLPNMFFLGYWPLYSRDSTFNYADLALDELISRGMPKQQVLHMYSKGSVLEAFNPWELVEKSLEVERAKEVYTPVKYVDALVAAHREMKLFHTVNHPTKAMMRRTSNAVLYLAGLDPLTDNQVLAAADPYADFELPIHPYVAKRQSFAFANPDTEYRLHGRRGTFDAYASCYVDCRLSGESSLVRYLHQAA